MFRKAVVIVIVAALLPIAVAFGQSSPSAVALSDADIRGVLADRVDTYRRSVGIVVGIIEPQDRRMIAYGARAPDDPRLLDGDTVFEIGSITKVFTALVLADMVRRGEVALTDPVGKVLPPEVKVPERNGQSITLQHLAMHVSALPRLPMNFRPKDAGDPYADYSVDSLYQFLSSHELRRDVGSRYEYSNLATGLLGHALARHAGMAFEELVRTRITQPLGLANTGIALSRGMKERLTPGHNEHLDRVPNWHLLALAGAGALRSTTNDLLAFLAANLGLEKSPLAEAMAAMRSVRGPRGEGGREMALGWMVSKIGDREIVWHNGATGGYWTFIGFDLKNRLGVVVLSNTILSIDDIGLHLLTGEFPLSKHYQEIPIDPSRLDALVGRYRLDDKSTIAITRVGDRLFAQPATQGRFGLFAKSDNEFFAKSSSTQIEAVPYERKELVLDAKLLDRYVGRYRLTPNFIITVIRDDDRLFAQATNQHALRIYPESDRQFFYRAVDAQITFVPDGDGPAASLILHQNGRDRLAPRVAGP
jgi:D-alanyl-D-alanine-carboxypeptidase/D-alanyl-D-alanine-endopeptidase